MKDQLYELVNFYEYSGIHLWTLEQGCSFVNSMGDAEFVGAHVLTGRRVWVVFGGSIPIS